MNKSERKELDKCEALAAQLDATPYSDHDKRAILIGIIARSMGTLVRSARSIKSRNELMQAADRLNVSGHSEFIVNRF